MPPIPYQGRHYVPPPVDPDDAGPIATRLDPDDFAIVSAKDETGRYIYERLVPIVVETGYPLDVPQTNGDRLSCTAVTASDTKGRTSVRSKQVLASWFPYSNDWEARGVFLGYSKKSDAEKQKRLQKFADKFEHGNKIWANYFQNKKSIDPFNGYKDRTVAYILDPQRSVDRSSKKVFSQRNQRATGKGRSDKAGKWLAIGICDDIDDAVTSILNEKSMQRLLQNQDALYLVERWKEHEVLHPFRLRDELLEFSYRETILKCAIRKAIAGPIDHQKSFVGKPVASWATSVFLETLYNLNRSDPDQSADESIVRKVPDQSLDFMMMVGCEIRTRGTEKHCDVEKITKSAVVLLGHPDFNYRLAGLARLSSLKDALDLDDSLKRKLLKMVKEDLELVVREAAKTVLADFDAE